MAVSLERKGTTEHAKRMADHQRNTRNTGGGEIVEVQGGHIVRSTGRKDRHSKVCTAKGPRDRRVRLAAHTAIQFYDVQDRLGYDRPSKAVDWLIKNAKSAIDELAELPDWDPITTCAEPPNAAAALFQQQQQQLCIGSDLMVVNEQQTENASFLPPSLDSNAVADTVKSFFPLGSTPGPSSTAMQFQSFPTPDLLPNTQYLSLSLQQSFQDPAMLHHQPHSQNDDHVLLTGIPLGFGGGWQEHRLGNWNADTASVSGGASGYLAAPLLQQMFSHNNQIYSQRGPLQSSNTPSVRAWMDPAAAVTIANTMADHNTSQHTQQQENQPNHHHHPSFVPIYPSSLSGVGFSSGFGGFSGFHVPAQIQGDEEEHDGYSDKPSSASSDSCH